MNKFIGPVQIESLEKLESIYDIGLQVMVMGITFTNFSDHREDTFGTLVFHRSVTAYFNMQQNCLELQNILYLAISFAQFIPTSQSSCCS